MKTLVLLITLLLVFVLGYMLGTLHNRPHERRPIPHSASGTSGSDAEQPN